MDGERVSTRVASTTGNRSVSNCSRSNRVTRGSRVKADDRSQGAVHDSQATEGTGAALALSDSSPTLLLDVMSAGPICKGGYTTLSCIPPSAKHMLSLSLLIPLYQFHTGTHKPYKIYSKLSTEENNNNNHNTKAGPEDTTSPTAVRTLLHCAVAETDC